MKPTQPDTAPPPGIQRITLAGAVRRCLGKYLIFSGRAPRAEFWKFILAIVLFFIVLVLINTAIFGPTHITAPGPDGKERLVKTVYDSGTFGSLVMLALIPAVIAAGWRRLHDRNHHGWWLLAPIAAQIIVGCGLALILIGPFRMWELYHTYNHFQLQYQGLPAQLVFYVLVTTWFALIVTLCRAGTPGPNRFGPNPLEVNK